MNELRALLTLRRQRLQRALAEWHDRQRRLQAAEAALDRARAERSAFGQWRSAREAALLDGLLRRPVAPAALQEWRAELDALAARAVALARNEEEAHQAVRQAAGALQQAGERLRAARQAQEKWQEILREAEQARARARMQREQMRHEERATRQWHYRQLLSSAS